MNKRNNYRTLIDALNYGTIDDIQQIIDSGASSKHTVLNVASAHGCINVVKYLVEGGINIHDDNDHALTIANQWNQHEVVIYLKNRMRLETLEAI